MSLYVDVADVIRTMRDLIEDAHDTHIFAEDDPHPADCIYCSTVKWANQVLTDNGEELT